MPIKWVSLYPEIISSNLFFIWFQKEKIKIQDCLCRFMESHRQRTKSAKPIRLEVNSELRQMWAKQLLPEVSAINFVTETTENVTLSNMDNQCHATSVEFPISPFFLPKIQNTRETLALQSTTPVMRTFMSRRFLNILFFFFF